MGEIILGAIILTVVLLLTDMVVNHIKTKKSRERYDELFDEVVAKYSTRKSPWSKPNKYYGSYEEYLASQEWFDKSREIKARDKFICQQCGATAYLEVHHITYLNLYNELPKDLITVCRNCHQDIHDIHKEAPYTLLT
jgi:5-methylcytosine-specific restriction endonuclease McrA